MNWCCVMWFDQSCICFFFCFLIIYWTSILFALEVEFQAISLGFSNLQWPCWISFNLQSDAHIVFKALKRRIAHTDQIAIANFFMQLTAVALWLITFIYFSPYFANRSTNAIAKQACLFDHLSLCALTKVNSVILVTVLLDNVVW